MSQRIAMGVEYDGTAYNGWQRQRTGLGVQAVLERALRRVAAHAVDVQCAGRTDAGVHATGQVVHFDTTAERGMRGWLLGANSTLPDDINVTWVRPVTADFHARYSARSRSYRYLILNRLVRSSLFRQRAWWLHTQTPLDVGRMQTAAEVLLGEHDFSAFRAAGCRARTPMREIQALTVVRQDDWVLLTITANAFLQHMVRNITGSLAAVGCAERPEGWVAELLDGRDRTAAGIAAPAQGLTLVSVDYPSATGLPVPDVPTLLPGVD